MLRTYAWLKLSRTDTQTDRHCATIRASLACASRANMLHVFIFCPVQCVWYCVSQVSVWRQSPGGLQSTPVARRWRLVSSTPVTPARTSVSLRVPAAGAPLAPSSLSSRKARLAQFFSQSLQSIDVINVREIFFKTLKRILWERKIKKKTSVRVE